MSFHATPATYKNIYKKYSGEFSKMEGDVLFKEISDLAYILYALESQQEIR
ncbi:hypothetical protein KJ671_02795 [Patescibacteria group bacterium]|nr:hypothetical protein [Patescibacteria group bacterium]